jgi:N utilization substance protein B
LSKKSHVAQGRRRARELAVQFLYSLEAHPDREMGEYLKFFTSEEGFAFEESGDVKEYLTFLAEGVWSRRVEIDNRMRQIVVKWRPERMASVDRIVLRVAIFEGFLAKNVALSIAISEAVDLAHSFGTTDSRKFVNGVLGKMARWESGMPLKNDKSQDDVLRDNVLKENILKEKDGIVKDEVLEDVATQYTFDEDG